MTELSLIAATVADLLKQRGDTIAVSESSCAGLLSAALVAIPGASAYYVGGAIIYTRAAQAGLLLVPDSAMEGQRASTEYYAALNAKTIREIHGTTWALSETGASGPTGNRYGDDAGHACIAVSGPRRARHHHRNRRQRPRSKHVGIRPRRLRPPRTVHQRSQPIIPSPSTRL